jgi:hypothetical protein
MPLFNDYLIVAEYMNQDGSRTYRALQTQKAAGFLKQKSFIDKMSDLTSGYKMAGLYDKMTFLVRTVKPTNWSRLYVIPFADAQRMYKEAANKDWHKTFPQLPTYKTIV